MSHFFLPTFLLPFFICLTVFTVAGAAVSGGVSSSPLIEKACSQARDKVFCINLLNSDPESKKAVDLKRLSYIALKKVEAEATATSLSIKVSMENQEINTEPGVEDALIDCGSHYVTLVELVEDTMNALLANSHMDVKKFVMAAVDDVKACSAGVDGLGGAAAQVAVRNRHLKKMINTAVSVVRVSQLP